MKTQQIIVIHGGDAFPSYEDYLLFLKSWEIDFERYRKGSESWKRSLGDRLGEGFEVITPDMPNKMNARYEEWKIWFDKFIPFLRDGVVFVGHSLGGTFLARYLSEEEIPVKIGAVLLVAAPYDEEGSDESLGDFVLPDALRALQNLGGRVFLYHSTDDPVVPFGNLAKYREELPEAVARSFRDREHFNQEEFPELVEDILKVCLKNREHEEAH